MQLHESSQSQLRSASLTQLGGDVSERAPALSRAQVRRCSGGWGCEVRAIQGKGEGAGKQLGRCVDASVHRVSCMRAASVVKNRQSLWVCGCVGVGGKFVDMGLV